MTRPTAGRASMAWRAFASAFLSHLGAAEQLDARAKLRQLAILRSGMVNPDAAARALGISAPPRPAPQPAPVPVPVRPQRSLEQLYALGGYDAPALTPQEARALDQAHTRERLRSRGYSLGQHL